MLETFEGWSGGEMVEGNAGERVGCDQGELSG